MSHFEPQGTGWQPSLPDFRDFTPESPPVQQLLQQLFDAGVIVPPAEPRVDLTEYFVDPWDQLGLQSSSAHACLGLLDTSSVAHGRAVRPSRMFLYYNARRLAGSSGDSGGNLRSSEGVAGCGVPPEHQWPYDPAHLDVMPEPYLYHHGAGLSRHALFAHGSAQSVGQHDAHADQSVFVGGVSARLWRGTPRRIVEKQRGSLSPDIRGGPRWPGPGGGRL